MKSRRNKPKLGPVQVKALKVLAKKIDVEESAAIKKRARAMFDCCRNVHHVASSEERARDKAFAQQIDREEAAEIRAMGHEVKARGDQLRAVFAELKQERQRQGLSLAQVADRSGIDKARLSRLENAAHPNVTFETLTRYAGAINKTVRVTLEDRRARA